MSLSIASTMRVRATLDLDGLFSREQRELAHDVMHGLSTEPKRLPSRWLYDEEGTRLYQQIMELPEYYPVSRESEILRREAYAISRLLGNDLEMIVELGAGDGRKTEHLLRAIHKSAPQAAFRPIDVSQAALKSIAARVHRALPKMPLRVSASDNDRALTLLERERSDRNKPICVMFLGSSIGNYERSEVLPFLHRLRACLRPGDHVILGFDLVKETDRLIRAYSDPSGVTRAFNLNLLYRLNRELGGDFNPAWFTHEAVYNAWSRGMESWLVSRREQVVTFDKIGWCVRLKKWEPMRTEISLKFEAEEIDRLAQESGFVSLARYHDKQEDFCDVVWRVKEMGASSSPGAHTLH